jgi:hypothetical protein
MGAVFAGFGTLCVLILSVVSTSFAQREADPVPITIERAEVVRLAEPLHTPQCKVGNDAVAAWAIPGFILPPEEYKVAFTTDEGCELCSLGLQISAVHIALYTEQPCELLLQATFSDLDPFADPACNSPGEDQCESVTYSAQLPGAGAYDISIPVSCGCADRTYAFAVGVRILSATCAGGTVPALLADDDPSVCRVWNDYGFGWDDLVTLYGFPGDLLLWADVQCCDNPIALDPESWGAIKSLFDD